MYFKTDKNSATGAKFTALVEKMKEAREAQIKLLEPLNVTEWNSSAFYIAGGEISSIVTQTPPDPKQWVPFKMENRYAPNKRTKAGKELLAQMDKLPRVNRSDLNACVGWNQRWSCIGFAIGENHYGFIVNEKYIVLGPPLAIKCGAYQEDERNNPIPDDCTEITFTEYNTLFPKEDQ